MKFLRVWVVIILRNIKVFFGNKHIMIVLGFVYDQLYFSDSAG